MESVEKKVEAEKETPELNAAEMVKKPFKLNLKMAFAKVSELLLNKGVFTVIITAILGPLAINWVNSVNHKLDIQTRIVSEILNYTDKTNFGSYESILRINVIAKMIDENKGIFDLEFTQTDSIVKMIHDSKVSLGFADLRKEISSKEEKINSYQVFLERDSVKKSELSSDVNSLKGQINEINTNSKLTIAEKNSQIASMNTEIKEKMALIKALDDSKKLYEDQIGSLTSARNELESKYAAAEKKLTEMTNENLNYISELGKNKTLLDQSQNDISSLRNALTETSTKLESSINLMQQYQNEITQLRNENDKLHNQLNIMSSENKSMEK